MKKIFKNEANNLERYLAFSKVLKKSIYSDNSIELYLRSHGNDFIISFREYDDILYICFNCCNKKKNGIRSFFLQGNENDSLKMAKVRLALVAITKILVRQNIVEIDRGGLVHLKSILDIIYLSNNIEMAFTFLRACFIEIIPTKIEKAIRRLFKSCRPKRDLKFRRGIGRPLKSHRRLKRDSKLAMEILAGLNNCLATDINRLAYSLMNALVAEKINTKLCG